MKIGLVLSGGGARGVAHIGVLKALKEKNIKITHIAGSSSGAIVGALYAAGHSWVEILDFFKEVPIFHYKRYAINKPGFIDTSKFYKDLLPFFEDDNFESLKKELYIPATNLSDGTEKIFHKGELINPILASAAYPGLFTPVLIDGIPFVDGGVLNNFPVAPLKKQCDKLIGVYVNPLEDINLDQLNHSYEIAERAYAIIFNNQCLPKFKEVDALISPKKLKEYRMFDLKNLDAIFEIGYEAAVKVLENSSFS